MRGTKEIIHEEAALPVEERALVVDSLLRTLNSPDSELDGEWVAVAKRRLMELRSGRVKPVPGSEVLAKARRRLGK
ncbi:MAG: addiction module protein [Acidobacteria bacterium]|nr:addiction module protein [Acidobacteriota bacterium]